MIAELGKVFLILSLIFSFYISSLPFLEKASFFKNQATTVLFCKLTDLIFICVLLSFICLTYSFVVSDFSLLITSKNSNSQLPLIYKITGVWGNHEGSILLWLLVMSFFGFLFSKNNFKDSKLKSSILHIQGLLSFLICLFIFFTSNPFERIFPPAIEGSDLNPLLQDPGLAIHPPFLYFGYVGFSIVYSMAIAGLLKGKISKELIILMRPWIFVSWTFLTCGIGLGSWWAYYELGWGGFWFWDPVENASLLPWLTSTALVHSVIVAEKKEQLVSWTMLLCIITFSLSLLGTFLVRSGVLVSVHAFANDPERGIFILVLLIMIIGFGLFIFIKRLSVFSKEKYIEPISREGVISLNNVFMLTLAGTILVGTIYPLISDAFFNKKISVGAPFFNAILIPFIIPLVLGMMFGPFLNWSKDDFKKIFKRVKLLLFFIFCLSLLFWYLQEKGPIISIIFFTLALWLGTSSIYEVMSKVIFNIKNKKKFFWKISSRIYSQSLAHLGIALIILGSTGASILKEEKIQFQEIGEKIQISDFKIEFMGVENKRIKNYRSDMAKFNIYKNGKFLYTLNPEKRYYSSGNQITTEAAIKTALHGDIYIAIGEKNTNFEDSWTTRIWYNPFVVWIWIGVIFMSFGGLISLSQTFKRL